MSSNMYSFYLNVAIQAIQRNNPITEIVERLSGLIDYIIHYQSNAKLNRYRQNLYMQQLNRMEGYLHQGSPYQYRGEKINRQF